jgi:hypothetical protein
MTHEIPFAFEIAGKQINPSDVTDPHEAAVLQNVVNSIVDRIEEMQCPLHKQPPRFVCRGDSVDALSLEVLGCCDALVDMVKERLAF